MAMMSVPQLKRSSGAKGWWISNKTFKISIGACSLMTKDITCNQSRQITFIWMLDCDWHHHAFHLSKHTWWSDWQLMRKEAGLGAQCGTLDTKTNYTPDWTSNRSSPDRSLDHANINYSKLLVPSYSMHCSMSVAVIAVCIYVSMSEVGFLVLQSQTSTSWLNEHQA